MSNFTTQIGGGQFHLQFVTTDEAQFLKMQQCARGCVDGVDSVRHGRWIYNRTTSGLATVKCSECGIEKFAISETVANGHYCPNCGCKMDGEE